MSVTEPTASPTTPPDRGASEWIPWTVLALLVLIVVPITVRRPLTGDCSIWNLLARVVERGGEPYRDVFETNLPGAVWFHLAVRATLGHTAEALRSFDLLLFAGTTGLLASRVVATGRPRSVGVWTAVAIVACYSSQSIWCQCQRDVWMLAFAVAAFSIRDPERGWPRSLVEGALWGVAASMKPFVLVPCLLVELVDRRRTVAGWLAAIAGLGAVAILNVGALVAMGAWESAVDIWTAWNPSYYAARMRLWNVRGLRIQFTQFGPWFAIHLTAIPIAIACLAFVSADEDEGRARRGLAALYLGWMVQAFALQYWHAYVHVPGLLLGFACVACESRLPAARVWWPTLLVFAGTVVAHSPPARATQLARWPDCFSPTITPAVRDDLRGPLDHVYSAGASWTELEPVVRFLRDHEVHDGDLLSYGLSTVVLYDALEVLPACRFPAPRFQAIYFPRRRDEVLAAIARAGDGTFVVTDLVIEVRAEDGPVNGARLVEPTGFPWKHEVVFRSGRYLVHRLDGPPGEFTAPTIENDSMPVREPPSHHESSNRGLPKLFSSRLPLAPSGEDR